MFEDAVVKRASHRVMSMSALFSKHLREHGWSEVRLFLFSVPTVFFRVNELRRWCQMALAWRT